MIQADCISNIDDFKSYEWPKVFICLPRVGDYVKSNKGQIMEVHSIYHGAIPTIKRNDGSYNLSEPYIEIYLKKISL